MSLTDFKNVERDVEVAKKKTPTRDEERQLQKPSQHRSQPNVLVLLVMIATACGVCAYAYHIALRIHRLERRVEMMSHVGCGSSGPATASSTTDRRCQTSATSTPSATILSSGGTSSPVNDHVWTDDRSKQHFDIDDEMYYYDDLYPDDEEDAEESSGDDSRHESYDSRQSYAFLRDRSYAGRRHKRSAEEVPTSDGVASPPRRRRQHQHQQHTGHRRGHRTTSQPVTARHQARNSRDERRRDRTGSVRQRRRPHGGDAIVGHRQVGGLKAAHFYAPRGPNNHYVSGSRPPATFPFWQAENWTLSHQDWFSLNNNGFVTILQPGLYMIYAQLVYHDLSGRWSFGVYVNDTERVKCMNTEQIDGGRHHRTSASHGVYQQCYTSTVLRLSRHDNLSIRCLYGSRSVVMQPEFTFWGLIQLTSS